MPRDAGLSESECEYFQSGWRQKIHIAYYWENKTKWSP